MQQAIPLEAARQPLLLVALPAEGLSPTAGGGHFPRGTALSRTSRPLAFRRSRPGAALRRMLMTDLGLITSPGRMVSRAHWGTVPARRLGQPLGQRGLRVALGLLKLRLRQPVSGAEVGACEMRPVEVGAVEMREAEVGAFQIRPGEDGAFEMHLVEGGAFEMRPVEVSAFPRCALLRKAPLRCDPERSSAFEIRVHEIGVCELRLGEVNARNIHSLISPRAQVPVCAVR